MTDKMPDEIYIADTSDGLYPPFYSKQPFIASISLKYISEQKHAEEVAALEARHKSDLAYAYDCAIKEAERVLKAEHRAEMAGLCDEIGTMKGRFHEMSPEERGFSIACADCIELIEQRISDELNH